MKSSMTGATNDWDVITAQAGVDQLHNPASTIKSETNRASMTHPLRPVICLMIGLSATRCKSSLGY